MDTDVTCTLTQYYERGVTCDISGILIGLIDYNADSNPPIWATGASGCQFPHVMLCQEGIQHAVYCLAFLPGRKEQL